MILEELNNWVIPKKCIFAAILFVSVGGIYVKKFWKCYTKKIYFEHLRKNKQKAKSSQRSAISRSNEMRLSTGDNHEILKMNFEELINFLREKEENYKLVFNIYQQQALRIDQRLNCVIEFLKLDVSDVDLNGPFAGIPVSIKDNLSLKEYSSYVGCSSFLGAPKATQSCVLVRVLQKLGAIPFVKTAVPQTMMTIFSSNPIDGLIKNPQNIKFISGGSSSGEGALVGAKGSIFGFGTDIGGSVRMPASFCGVVSLKPTVGRMSTKGITKLGIPSLVKSVIGPICPDVSSCTFAMRSILNCELMSKYDPQIPFLPFNEKKFTKKNLKIGYFVHDDSYHVMPANRRAVEESVKRLREKGHECVEWKPPKSGKDWWQLYLRSISTDGGRKLKSIIENDQIDDSIANGIIHMDFSIFNSLYNYFKSRMPDWIVDREWKLFYRSSVEVLNGHDCITLMTDVETFRVDVINDWSKCGLDGVICPAGGFTSFPLHTKLLYAPLLSYIFIWNLINFPAGTVPITTVNSNDLEEMNNLPLYKSTPTLKNISNAQRETKGLSVSVQCVSLPWNEELCLNLMKEVEVISSIS